MPLMSFIHLPVRVKKLKSRRLSPCLLASVSVDKRLSGLLRRRRRKRASTKLNLQHLSASSTPSPQRFAILQRKHAFLSFYISHVKISITSLSLCRDVRFETEVNQRLWLEVWIYSTTACHKVYMTPDVRPYWSFLPSHLCWRTKGLKTMSNKKSEKLYSYCAFPYEITKYHV